MGTIYEIDDFMYQFNNYIEKKYRNDINVPLNLEEYISNDVGMNIQGVYNLNKEYLEFDEYESWSNPGYSGGYSFDKVIIGKKEVINKYRKVDQYTTTDWVECKVYPVDGVIVTYDNSDWTGTSEYTAYITQSYRERALKEIEKNKKVNVLYRILDIYSKKMDDKLKNIADDVIKKVKYIRIDKGNDFDKDGIIQTNNEYEYIYVYDKNNNKLLEYTYKSEYYSGLETEYSNYFEINTFSKNVGLVFCDVEGEKYWETVGFSNRNEYVEKEEINLDIEYYKFYLYIYKKIKSMKFRFNKKIKMFERS